MTRVLRDESLLANHVLELFMLAGCTIGLFVGWWLGGSLYHVLGGLWCGGIGGAALALLGYAALKVGRATAPDSLGDAETREELR